jgi:hypothetical protein
MVEAAVANRFYQDRRNGQRVRMVGGASTKEEFILVEGQDRKPYYAELSQLVPCDEQGRPDFDARLEGVVAKEEKDETPPEPVIPIVETRLNLNMATAEEIAKRVPGVGYRIAKRIVDTRLTLPAEKFVNLEQVVAVSNRVNWDEVLRSDLVFVA